MLPGCQLVSLAVTAVESGPPARICSGVTDAVSAKSTTLFSGNRGSITVGTT